MRILTALIALLGLLLPGVARADLRVVATVPDLAAIAREVGGEHVTVTALALPTQDPHFVDARPDLALALSRADLLLVVGLDLEVGWLPTLQTGARNAAIQSGSPGYLDCSQFVQLLQVPVQQVDRSMGDIHPGGNPHYLFDPRRVRDVAAGVAGRLAQLDPEWAEHYATHLADFQARLDDAMARWARDLAPLRGQPVIGFHMSWPYLADWLGLEMVEHIEPKPGIPPTPAHVARVLGVARQRGVKIILQEVYYPSTTAELVAEKAGAKVVVLQGGPDVRGGQGWIAYWDEQVRRLQGARP